MDKCAYPGCHGTVSKESRFCLTHEGAERLMDALQVPESAPPVRLHTTIMKAIQTTGEAK